MWGNPDRQLMDAEESREDLMSEGREPDGQEWWLHHSTWEIECLFEDFKNKFLNMEWLPHPYHGATDVWEVGDGLGKVDEKLKMVMVDAGWPDDGEAGGWK